MKHKKEVPMNESEVFAEEANTTTTEFPTLLTVEPEQEVPAETPLKKKRGGLFRRREVKEQQFLIESPVVQTVVPLETDDTEDVKVFGSETEIDDTREISVSQDTKVIEMADDDTEPEAAPVTQLQLEGFTSEKVVAPKAEEDEQEALKRVRKEKIQDFSLRREQHQKETAESAKEQQESVDEAEPVVESEETTADQARVAEEFTEYSQVADLQKKLLTERHSARTTLVLSALAEAVLFVSALVSLAFSTVSVNAVSYLLVQLLVFIALVAVNLPLLKNGFSKLFSGNATMESGVAVAAVFTLVHTALQFLNTYGVADGSSPLLTALTGFALLLLQVCRFLACDRMCRNFSAVSVQGEKMVARRIENDSLAEEIGRPAVAMGVPRVAYFRKTAFTSQFFESMGDSSAGQQWMKWYLPLSLGLSAAISLIYLLANGLPSWIFSVTLFCLMVCISMPIFMLFFLQASISLISLSLRKKATAVMGYDTVREYGSLHAVTLDATDLFPQSSVMLHGIKTFSGTRIDQAILDAASVSIRAGGPLSHVFRRMILNKVDMLHDVDTLVYEQDMGLSGWVSGRRVLIGNRRLLDNHGIYIPSKDYEDRYAKDGRQLVYLSIAGELSAMFVVSYTADETVKRILTELTSRRVTLLVRSCDPNITEKLLASVFELNGFYIELLGAPAGRSYEILVSGVTPEEPATIVSRGGVNSMLRAVAKCRLLRTGIRVFTVLQSVFGLAALLAVGGLALFGGLMLSPLFALELSAIGLVVTGVISLFFTVK